MTESSAVHLTTTRVNRLLRPLKNKCNSLAALPKSAVAARATCSKQSSNWDPDGHPPLTLFCPPTGIRKLTCDKRTAEEYELSRRIYAVCDAFKNIVHAACEQPRNQRIPSLAVMCTLLIGGSMLDVDSDGTLVDPGEDPLDEHDPLDADDIYEAVPSHYRRFLLVSHALSMILSICTHHHTLVTILLEHCLSFGLVHESARLLNILLAQALLSSSSSYLPPATHPAYANYLLDLHAKWTSANKQPRASSEIFLFTTSTFCQAMLDTLSQSSCNSQILWTSNVLNKLLHVVGTCDLDSYVNITHALSWSFREASLDATQGSTQLSLLCEKLSELMSNLFDLLFVHNNPHPTPLMSPRIYTTMDILDECHVAQLHFLKMSNPDPPIKFSGLSDIITSFTTHTFVACRDLINNSDRLSNILGNGPDPVPTTFNKLMVHFSRLRDSQAFGDFMEAFLTQLEIYSSALRSKELFALDASLWGCGLNHFDTSMANSQQANFTLVTKYRQQLMGAVEAAERRCFGGDMENSPVVSAIRSNRVKHTQRGRANGHWEWEVSVGSWIRKTPVPKKPKTNKGRLLGHFRPREITVIEAAAGSPLSIFHRNVSTLSPTSASEPTEFDGSDYRDETDKENHPSSPPPTTKQSRHAKRRRSSNFDSLLADAQTNRIVLHPKPRLKPKTPSFVISERRVPPLLLQRPRQAPRKQEQKVDHRKALPSASSRVLFSSDDSLDLFACATSSPASGQIES